MLSALEQRIREHDNDRFLTSLFAPESARADLYVLYAFNLELAKLRETISEALIGRMRLQFWRDAISAIADGKEPPQHEVAVPLADLIARFPGLSEDLMTLIDGREIDLDDEPPLDMNAFESYAEATSSALLRASARVLEQSPDGVVDLTRHAGIAIATVGAVRALPYQVTTGRVTIPAELCRAIGLDPMTPFQWPKDLDFRPLSLPLLDLADRHIRAARSSSQRAAKKAMSPFLMLSLAALYHNRLRRAGGDPLALVASPPGVARPWTVLAASLKGRP